MKDYSQDREQLAVMEALGGEDAVRANPKTIMELGAWNATVYSNSRALIECGWKAIMVEPSAKPMSGLIDEYGHNPNVTLVQAVAGIWPSMVKMHITDDAVSTSDQGVYDTWKGQTTFRGDVFIPVVSLEQLTNQFGGADVWSVDCEGVSVDLFHRMMLLNIHPRVIVVEFDNRMAELLSAATGVGYKCCFSNATNVVLVNG